MELTQKQHQAMNAFQLESVHLLQMDAVELDRRLQELSLENPMLDYEPAGPPEWADLRERYGWEGSRGGRAEDERGPWDVPGGDDPADETLAVFLERQFPSLGAGGEELRLLRLLAASLDEAGYFREPIGELAAAAGVPAPKLAAALSLLQSLEPAGIGARDLGECLALQLKRRGGPAYAVEIAARGLPLLAEGRDRELARRCGIDEAQVAEARRLIRQMDPRPGDACKRRGETVYLLPDVLVERVGDELVPVLPEGHARLRINEQYRELLHGTEDESVRRYLTDKKREAELVLRSVRRRGSTLLRCAEGILRKQRNFFKVGESALRPYSMRELGEEIGLHFSTVSRAVHAKYLQCDRGTYPFTYFFTASAAQGGCDVGSAAAKAILRRIIDEEDTPLSDRALSERMAARGCPLSRRTVAKYRMELGIPDRDARRYQKGQTNASAPYPEV